MLRQSQCTNHYLHSWFQIINVYNQEYESAAAFWPQVHSRVIASLLISHVTLFGLLSTMKAAYSTPLLIFLPLLTLWFHKYCKSRFEPAFRKYPLEVSASPLHHTCDFAGKIVCKT